MLIPLSGKEKGGEEHAGSSPPLHTGNASGCVETYFFLDFLLLSVPALSFAEGRQPHLQAFVFVLAIDITTFRPFLSSLAFAFADAFLDSGQFLL